MYTRQRSIPIAEKLLGDYQGGFLDPIDIQLTKYI